jgi:o-succinylbenzoate synthase
LRRSLKRLAIPLRQPFATATGVVAARELLLLRLDDDDGCFGYGEAAPFEPYDGVSVESVMAALTGGLSSDRVPAQARAAEEMALLDLAARREGRPVGEPGAEVLAVNRTLPAGPPDEVAARAREGLGAGYGCFKLKVGLPDDGDRVAAVREAIGPWPALRVDANGGWSPRDAIATIEALEPYDLQLVEQPCSTLEELAQVRSAVGVPIAADESIQSAGDVHRAARARACDAVNVKLAGSGGFDGARQALRAAGEKGLAAYLSSTLDGPWGIAAALQLGAAEAVSMACGLATLELFDARLAETLPPPRRGVMEVPAGPGLGVAPDAAVLSEVLVEEVE